MDINQTDILLDELMPMLIDGGIVDIATMERLIRELDRKAEAFGKPKSEAYADLAYRARAWLVQSMEVYPSV